MMVATCQSHLGQKKMCISKLDIPANLLILRNPSAHSSAISFSYAVFMWTVKPVIFKLIY